MKKASILITILCMCFTTYAQAPDPFSDNTVKMEIVSTCRLIIILAIYTIAILVLVKLILEYSIKSKIVNNDIPEPVVSRLLPARNVNKTTAIKWVALLTSAGIGLLFVYWMRPFGIHSLAVFCLSLAGGFLGYHLLLRQNK